MYVDWRGDGSGLVVGLHGMPTPPDVMWPALPVATHRCANVHLPGYGRSPALPGPHDLRDVEDALIAQLDLDGAVLVGFSGGAWRALSLALRDDVQPAALVLMGAFARIEDQDRPAFAGLIDALRAGVDLSGAVRDRFMTAEEQRRPEAAQVDQWMAATSGDNLADELEALLAADDLAPRLGQLDLPVLVLVGEHDAANPVPLARELAQALPRGELVVIKGAGHAAPVFQPQQVAAAVDDFLARSLG